MQQRVTRPFTAYHRQPFALYCHLFRTMGTQRKIITLVSPSFEFQQRNISFSRILPVYGKCLKFQVNPVNHGINGNTDYQK